MFDPAVDLHSMLCYGIALSCKGFALNTYDLPRESNAEMGEGEALSGIVMARQRDALIRNGKALIGCGNERNRSAKAKRGTER